MFDHKSIIERINAAVVESIESAVTITKQTYQDGLLFSRWALGHAALMVERTYKDDALTKHYSEKIKEGLGKSGASLVSKSKTVAKQCGWSEVLVWQDKGLSFDTIYSIANLDAIQKTPNGLNFWATWMHSPSPSKERTTRELWKNARQIMKDSGEYFHPSKLVAVLDARAKYRAAMDRPLTEEEQAATPEPTILHTPSVTVDLKAALSTLAKQYSSGQITELEFSNKMVSLTSASN